jgi:hypothetical protein
METIFARFTWLSGEGAIGETYNAWLSVSSLTLMKENVIQSLRVADCTFCLTFEV